jgi:hypothetical protein
MATSFYSDHGGKLEGSTVTMNDDFDMTDLPPEKAGTALDRRDMARMGKVQEMRRNFSFIPIFGFAAVLMITWEAVFNSASYVLINGGLAGMVWMYMVTFFGFGAAILAMAEMASMAPTSGGMYSFFSALSWGNWLLRQLCANICITTFRSIPLGVGVRTKVISKDHELHRRMVLCSRLAGRHRRPMHHRRPPDHRHDFAQQ